MIYHYTWNLCWASLGCVGVNRMIVRIVSIMLKYGMFQDTEYNKIIYSKISYQMMGLTNNRCRLCVMSCQFHKLVPP